MGLRCHVAPPHYVGRISPSGAVSFLAGLHFLPGFISYRAWFLIGRFLMPAAQISGRIVPITLGRPSFRIAFSPADPVDDWDGSAEYRVMTISVCAGAGFRENSPVWDGSPCAVRFKLCQQSGNNVPRGTAWLKSIGTGV